MALENNSNGDSNIVEKGSKTKRRREDSVFWRSVTSLLANNSCTT